MLVCVAAAPAARAQGVDLGGAFDRSERIEITADSIEYQRDREIYVAEGNVRIVRGARSLDARWTVFSKRTRLGVASGDVVFRDGSDRLDARFIQFDVDTLEGVIFEGNLDMGEDGLRIASRELVRTGEDRYRIFDASFTTCRCPQGERDPWVLHAGRSDVHVGGYGTARNTTFQVLGIPVIWVPWTFFPVKTERQTGLLIPQVDFGGRNGFGFGLPVFWAARHDLNATATPRWSKNRGYKQDVELDTVYGERSRTKLFGSYAYDEEVKALLPNQQLFSEHRWAAGADHDQELPLGFRLQADANFVSDNQFVLDYDDFLEHKRDRYLESAAFLTRHFGPDGRLGFQAASLHADDLQNPDGRDRDSFLLQRWADIELDWLSGPLPGVSWLSGTLAIDYERFDRGRSPARKLGVADAAGFLDIGIDALPSALEQGAGADPHGDDLFTEGDGLFEEGEPLTDFGHRLTLHPRLSLPLRVFGALELLPEVGYRETLYWSDQRDFERRGQLTARSDLRMRFERDYRTPGGATLRHAVIPHVGWALISQTGQQGDPLFVPRTALPQRRLRQLALDSVVLDPADRVPSTDQLVVGVDQRFYTAGGEGEAALARRLRGELGIGIDYDFASGGLGRLVFDGRTFDVMRTSTRFHLVIDPDGGQVDEVLAELGLSLPYRIQTSVRYRYVRDAPLFFENFQNDPERFSKFEPFDRIDQIRLYTRIPFLERWAVTYDLRYSFAGSTTLTNSGGIEYTSKCRCWAVGIELDESRSENLRVQFRYTLLGFGDSGGLSSQRGTFLSGGPR